MNDSFGMINHLEMNLTTRENDMDLTNQIAYLNQARFEDITLMECDIGCHNLRNQLENDLEPMNVELLQELLGAIDPTKNELETFLNRPFDPTIEIPDIDGHLSRKDINYQDVDLDRTFFSCDNVAVSAVDGDLNPEPYTEAQDNQCGNENVANIE